MRRISRIDRSVGLIRRQINFHTRSPYLCLECKHQCTPFSTSSVRTALSNPKTPFTEKVRQRIWGTDKPLGLEDPYGDGSVFDRTKEPVQEQEVGKSATEHSIHLEGYEPATSWTDLEWVGGDPIWEPEEDFEGFLPADPARGAEQITAALHRAMVEVFALQQLGKSLHDASSHFPGVDPNDDWTDDVQITPSPAEGATLQTSENSLLQKVMEPIAAPSMNDDDVEVETTKSQEDVAADRSEEDPLENGETPSSESSSEHDEPTESEEDITADRSTEDPLKEARTYKDVISSWDPSWLQISIKNPEVKFAVLKRTMQLTGVRVPDAAIKSANTAKALLTHLVTPPKPRKLVEALRQNDELVNLGNVNIWPKKLSFVDREKRIGRWKVIEKELEARGHDPERPGRLLSDAE